MHLGFDINRSIPRKLFLTNGKGDERPFVTQILEPGETGVLDRGYQQHVNLDRWHEERKHFVCRIKEGTTKACLEAYPVRVSCVTMPKFYWANLVANKPKKSYELLRMSLKARSTGWQPTVLI